ncbi:MAG: hypothetical protein OEZ06_15740 [Myxococcales bacterium]|nr:hypothetical protein [Myxococcales bacterium]
MLRHSRWVAVLLLLGPGSPGAAQQPAAAPAPKALPEIPLEPQLIGLQGLSGEALGRAARELGSDSPHQRQAAAGLLSTLGSESLPGITARLKHLAAKRRPGAEDARAAMTAIRHAAGSRRADDDADLAKGVLSALAESRDAARLAIAEPLLLLRSLEAIGGRTGGRQIAQILTLDDSGLWTHEGRLVQKRMGLRLLPALIELRSHEKPWVRRWAQRGVHTLGMEEPKAATSLEDRALVAEVIAAYTEPLDFPAMPIVVRLTASEGLQVRAAARRAVAAYGKNARWKLRELYRELAGKPATKAWSPERVASELYAVIDRADTKKAEALLAKGAELGRAGDLAGAQRHFDELLARFPDFGRRAELAAGYAAIGAEHLAADRLEASRAAYARALRLSPQHDEAASWRAQLAYVGAERALSRGVVDLHSYGRALQLDSKHAAASHARDRLSGRSESRQRSQRRLAAGSAIGLLLAILLLLRRRQGDSAASPTAG